MSRAASSNDTCGNEREEFGSALGIILSRSHPPPSKKVIHRRNPRILRAKTFKGEPGRWSEPVGASRVVTK